jgi:transposase-like protein
MEEEAIARFDYPAELKEKLVELVVYQNYSKEAVAKKYGLANTYMLTNWITVYKKKLEKGAVTLAPMEKPKTKDTAVLKKRIKDLEKALEKANVLIYGLNSMIDHAEKAHKVPIRKKDGTKQ